MQIQKYAPVYIPTLNRYEHFIRCLESLERCTGADMTDVYVGLDYPPSEKYVEGWKKIDAYLAEKEKFHGFRNLYVRRRDHNCGVGKPGSNGSLLLEEIKKVSDRYIVSEDDNEFSPNFLSYCNWALDYFKEDKSIFYICGYNLIETPFLTSNIYKYNHGFCGWGCATWLDRRERELESYDFGKMKEFVDSLSIFDVFCKRKMSIAGSLLYMIKKQYVLGDTAIQTIPEENRWCVFPKLSKVRNWGHDGSGLHGGTQASHQKQINQYIDNALVFEPHIEGDLYTPEIGKAYNAKYGHKPLLYIIRSMLRFLIYKISGRIIVLERPSWLK